MCACAVGSCGCCFFSLLFFLSLFCRWRKLDGEKCSCWVVPCYFLCLEACGCAKIVVVCTWTWHSSAVCLWLLDCSGRAKDELERKRERWQTISSVGRGDSQLTVNVRDSEGVSFDWHAQKWAGSRTVLLSSQSIDWLLFCGLKESCVLLSSGVLVKEQDPVQISSELS